jgi:hypothetical protein
MAGGQRKGWAPSTYARPVYVVRAVDVEVPRMTCVLLRYRDGVLERLVTRYAVAPAPRDRVAALVLAELLVADRVDGDRAAGTESGDGRVRRPGR